MTTTVHPHRAHHHHHHHHRYCHHHRHQVHPVTTNHHQPPTTTTTNHHHHHHHHQPPPQQGMLEENPANQLVLKRQVCVLKAQNKIPAAIKCLNNYLKQFQADANAWQELADLYLSGG